MPEQPDEAAIRQVHEIARQLARRQGLSEDDAEEVCGHLEDKLLAYMRGEVRITREDALLLARAHFGDSAGVARQLAYHGDPPRPELVRRRMIVRTAIFAAVCTLIALPGALLLFGEAPPNLRDMLAVGTVLLGCLMVVESGVLLAALTDPQSRWQRAMAGAFVLPALAGLYVALASGLSAFSAHWRLPTRGEYAVIVAIELICFIAHALLVLLLALPLRGATEAFSSSN